MKTLAKVSQRLIVARKENDNANNSRKQEPNQALLNRAIRKNSFARVFQLAARDIRGFELEIAG